MCLLQSKAPSISKIYPTLLFLPVFKMYSHGMFTLLHWSTYSTVSTLLYLRDSVIFTLSSYTSVGRFFDWTKSNGRKWPAGVKIWTGDKNVMVGQNVMVGYALLMGGKSDQSYLEMSLDTLVIILVHWEQKFWYWGGFVAIKTNFCFERHVWTSAKNGTPWKRREKCLWAWPLCW